MSATETLIEKVEHAVEDIIHEVIGGGVADTGAAAADTSTAAASDTSTTAAVTNTPAAADTGAAAATTETPVHPAVLFLDRIEALALKWGGDVGAEIRNLVGSVRGAL